MTYIYSHRTVDNTEIQYNYRRCLNESNDFFTPDDSVPIGDLPECGNQTCGNQIRMTNRKSANLLLGRLSKVDLAEGKFSYQHSFSYQILGLDGQREVYNPAWKTTHVLFDIGKLLTDHNSSLQGEVLELSDLSSLEEKFKEKTKGSLRGAFQKCHKLLHEASEQVKGHFTKGRSTCLVPKEVSEPKRAKQGNVLFEKDKPFPRDLKIRLGSNLTSVHGKFLCKVVPEFGRWLDRQPRNAEDEVTPEGMNEETLNLWIRFAYGLETEITEENVESLMRLAEDSDSLELKFRCLDVLQRKFHDSEHSAFQEAQALFSLESLEQEIDSTDLSSLPELVQARVEAMKAHLSEIDHFYRLVGEAQPSPISQDALSSMDEAFSNVFERASVDVSGAAEIRMKKAAKLMAFSERIERFLRSRAPQEEVADAPFAEYFRNGETFPFDLRLEAKCRATGEMQALDLHRGFIDEIPFFATMLSTPVGKKEEAAAQEEAVCNIKVEEVSFEVLHVLARFAYKGSFEEIDSDTALELFVAADYLQAEDAQRELRPLALRAAIALPTADQFTKDQQPKTMPGFLTKIDEIANVFAAFGAFIPASVQEAALPAEGGAVAAPRQRA